MRLRTVLAAAMSVACVAAPLAAKTPVKHQPAKHHKAVVRHAAAPKGFSISMDEVRVVTFQRPISTVFVGNPTIADATVIDPYHAFILGKQFGTTNLIALGPQSQTVSNEQITVVNRGGGLVTLNKGSQQFSYACTRAHCDASPLPGDQTQYFNDVNGSVNSHQDQAFKAANVAAAQH
jgi:Pilus formation protein N terminal region